MEALEIGAGVEHVALASRAPGRHQATLDGSADGDDSVHARARVAEPASARNRKTDASVQDETGTRADQAGQDGQRARSAFVRVDDLRAAGAGHPGQTPHRPPIVGTAHLEGDMVKSESTTALDPHRAGRGTNGDDVAAGGEAHREVAELNRGAREKVRLGIELKYPEGLSAQAPKNSRTAPATTSISSSVCPAEIGRVRISSTRRSVA